MRGKSLGRRQLDMFNQRLADQLNPKHPLYRLGNTIPWDKLEHEFFELYSSVGRNAHPIRLMVELLILKQLRNLSDESVAERWVENGYYQYFCGEKFFKWKFPCHPTDLVLFRKRIGEEGVEKIVQISIELHGSKAKGYELLIDSTVQEKNRTFPTDTKLYERISKKCVAIADKEELKLRQTYRRTLKKLILAQRFRNHPKNYRKARKAARKLPVAVFQQCSALFEIFDRVLDQQRNSSKKIYSIHEPDVYCIGKGKAYKKYEFGAKASIAVTKNSGIIVAAISHPENIHDSKTLVEGISQSSELRGQCPKVTIWEKGNTLPKAEGEEEIS